MLGLHVSHFAILLKSGTLETTGGEAIEAEEGQTFHVREKQQEFK